MPVIAMTQEMGSLAKDVSLQLADALGLAVMRHEVIEHVADRDAASPSSLIGRLRDGKAGLVERLTTDQRSVALYTAEEVFALADARQRGAARLGRHLPAAPGAARGVRAHHAFAEEAGRMADGPPGHRRRRVRRGRDPPQRPGARRAHARAVRRHLGRPGALRPGAQHRPRVGRELRRADPPLASRPEFAETPESRALLASMALEARVRAALKEHADTRDIQHHDPGEARAR